MLQDIDGNLNIFTSGNLNLLHLAIDSTDVAQAKISGSQVRSKSRSGENGRRYLFFHLAFIKLYILFALVFVFINKFFVLVLEIAFLFLIGVELLFWE